MKVVCVPVLHEVAIIAFVLFILKVANSEDYFIANGSSKRIATSDHTLSHLKTPRLSADTLQMVLSEVGPSHPEEQKAMMQEHSSYFSRWMTLLW